MKRHFRQTDGLTAGYGNMKILLQAAVILFLVFCARGVDAADGDSSSPLDKQAPILPHSLEVFEVLNEEGRFSGCGVKFTIIGYDNHRRSGGIVLLRGALSTIVVERAFGMVLQVLPFDFYLADEPSKATAQVFEASYAYLKSSAGIALPDRQAIDDCGIAELEEDGFCRIIQDDYTNPVVAAMILGAFSIFYTRAGQDTEVEVSVEPQHVAAHQQYVAEMSGCMNKTMQMLREQGYGK